MANSPASKKSPFIVCVTSAFLLMASLGLAADIQLSPQLSSKYLAYFESVSPNTNSSLWSLKEDVSGRWKLNSQWKINFRARAQQDPSQKSLNEKYYADLPELYLEFKKDNWRLQAGQMTFTWAGTDGYNPVDIVSAKRLFDPLDSEKLGAPAVSAILSFGAFDFQGLFIPLQSKTVLPGENSRWLPREIYVPPNSNYSLILPDPLFYNYVSDNQWDRALDNNMGARLHTTWEGSDIALMYFEGAAQIPALTPTINGTITSIANSQITIQAQSPLILQPQYYRVRSSGLTFSTTLGSYIARLASAYTQPLSVGQNIPGWSHATVMALEKSFSLGSHHFVFLPQYSFSKSQSSAGNEITSLNRVFDSALLLGLRYTPTDTLVILTNYLYDLLAQEQFLGLDITQSLNDHLKATLNVQILTVQSNAPLGAYRKNSRGALSVTWLF